MVEKLIEGFWHTPRLRGLRSASANPLAGGDTDGPAKPVPWCLLDLVQRRLQAVFASATTCKIVLIE